MITRNIDSKSSLTFIATLCPTAGLNALESLSVHGGHGVAIYELNGREVFESIFPVITYLFYFFLPTHEHCIFSLQIFNKLLPLIFRVIMIFFLSVVDSKTCDKIRTMRARITCNNAINVDLRYLKGY